ncbi:MAG: RNA-binding protein [Gammaproteobacteria bacterium]|nr:RNA-binding protein [Gammaproteobacteria bacterium]
MNIYVGNLPYSVRDEELRTTFEAFGKVVSAEVIFDKRTRRSRGYGFVDMADEAAGRRAIDELNGKELHGRELRVDASQPKTEGQMSEARAPSGGRARRSPRGDSTATSAAPGPSGAAPSGVKGFLKRLFG